MRSKLEKNKESQLKNQLKRKQERDKKLKKAIKDLIEKEILAKKGKIFGILIEGHEKFWKIKKIINQKLIDKWIYANSSHTIDLLRFFGGEFQKVHTLKNSERPLS